MITIGAFSRATQILLANAANVLTAALVPILGTVNSPILSRFATSRCVPIACDAVTPAVLSGMPVPSSAKCVYLKLR